MPSARGSILSAHQAWPFRGVCTCCTLCHAVADTAGAMRSSRVPDGWSAVAFVDGARSGGDSAASARGGRCSHGPHGLHQSGQYRHCDCVHVPPPIHADQDRRVAVGGKPLSPQLTLDTGSATGRHVRWGDAWLSGLGTLAISRHMVGRLCSIDSGLAFATVCILLHAAQAMSGAQEYALH